MELKYIRISLIPIFFTVTLSAKKQQKTVQCMEKRSETNFLVELTPKKDPEQNFLVELSSIFIWTLLSPLENK